MSHFNLKTSLDVHFIISRRAERICSSNIELLTINYYSLVVMVYMNQILRQFKYTCFKICKYNYNNLYKIKKENSNEITANKIVR
jgi:hypothetical protein